MKSLFVDDDADERGFFLDALSYVNKNIKCVTAKNSKEALAMLNSASELPAYVFLDIHMPEMDGKECLRAIKSDERFQGIRIVMYSNASDEALMAGYKKEGATYFLVKPATFKDLCDSLSVLFSN
jgi:CheY-like chemotaxis protein